jgi:hypothetical protein
MLQALRDRRVPAGLGLVGIEIIENDMNFFFVPVAINDAIHEIQELPASSRL